VIAHHPFSAQAPQFQQQQKEQINSCDTDKPGITFKEYL
jgi:hypothetical protein